MTMSYSEFLEASAAEEAKTQMAENAAITITQTIAGPAVWERNEETLEDMLEVYNLMRPLTPTQMAEHNRYQTDLRYFCRKALKIKLKVGGYAPFVWNKARSICTHGLRINWLERVWSDVHLKGRQQGISTYIARLYHKATRNSGRRVFILSHHSSTTGTLFQIVDMFHNGAPAPHPRTGDEQ